MPAWDGVSPLVITAAGNTDINPTTNLSVTVKCVAAGGGGGGGNNGGSGGAGGGGGGATAGTLITMLSTKTYRATIGSGGSGGPKDSGSGAGNGGNGGNTKLINFTDTITLVEVGGGTGGQGGSGSAGTGGSLITGTNGVTGGNGGTSGGGGASSSGAGGGGGGGNPLSSGGNGGNGSYGTGGSGGAPAVVGTGNGAAGPRGGGGDSSFGTDRGGGGGGGAGASYSEVGGSNGRGGGGGGGAAAVDDGNDGGAGSNGQMVLTAEAVNLNPGTQSISPNTRLHYAPPANVKSMPFARAVNIVLFYTVIIPALLFKCDTDDELDVDEAFQGYIDTRAYAPEQSMIPLTSYSEPILQVKASTGNSVQVTINREFSKETRSVSVDLTRLSNESNCYRVIRKLEGLDLADIGIVQFRIGDMTAVASNWSLERLDVPEMKDGDR